MTPTRFVRSLVDECRAKARNRLAANNMLRADVPLRLRTLSLKLDRASLYADVI